MTAQEAKQTAGPFWALGGHAVNTASRADHSRLVKKGERLCTRCFQKRGGVNFFARQS